MNTPGQYKLAATLVALIGIVHLAVMSLGQFKSNVTGLIVPMVICFLLALLLFLGKRWAAWLAFLCTLIGITGAIMRFYSNSSFPDWVFPCVIALNLLAAAVLFVILWKSTHKYNNRLETHAPATVSSHHSKA